MSFLREAHTCRIYGTLKENPDGLTALELSDRLGIPERDVRNICQERDYNMKGDMV